MTARDRKRGTSARDAARETPFDIAFRQTATALEFSLEGGDVGRAVEVGIGVLRGAKKSRKRPHELGDLIEQIFLRLKRAGHEPTAKDVVHQLRRHAEAGDRIIQEVLPNRIDWIDRNGRERSMSIRRLQNRIAQLHKR